MFSTLRQSCLLLITLFLLLFTVCNPGHGAEAYHKDYFPNFKSIQKNVAFWTKIYADIPVNKAILHDKNDLSIIYETISIVDPDLPGARKINKKRIKAIKKNYAHTLRSLGSGRSPSTPFEKRIYAKFGPPDRRMKMKKAANNLRTQIGLKERFRNGVVRSGAYIDEMKRIFRSYNLPEDLAYLPHVESSFNIGAYSKHGAAGVWQFTRSTGRNYMTISSIIDERRDPLRATHAAAQYLKSNFEKLGSWPLALTAYNYGHAGMLRAAKQEGTYERIFKFYTKGHFKFASRNFYSEFLAAREVAKRLERLPSLTKATPKEVFEFTLPAYVSALDICIHFNLSIRQLKNHNPAFLKPLWLGEKYIPKGYRVKIPATTGFSALAVNLPSSMLKRSQRKDHTYIVKRGDTASTIAKRHKVSLTSLIRINTLSKDGRIYAGQTLKIPHITKKTPRKKKVAVIKRSRVNSRPLPTLKPEKKSSPKTQSAQTIPPQFDIGVSNVRMRDGIFTGEIVVHPGESLGMYAKWLNIPPKSLREVNALSSSDTVHPGQTLTILLTKTSKNTFESHRSGYHRQTATDFLNSYKITGVTTYQVASGDTLWKICQKKFDLPLWLLKRFNHDLNYNSITYNQHLNIPIIEAL